MSFWITINSFDQSASMNLHVVHLINNTFDGSVYNHCLHDEAVLALFDTRQCRGTKTLRTALSLPKQAARLLRSSAIFMTLTLQHQCHYSCQRAVITKCSGGIGKPLTRRLVVSENYLVLDEDNGFNYDLLASVLQNLFDNCLLSDDHGFSSRPDMTFCINYVDYC